MHINTGRHHATAAQRTNSSTASAHVNVCMPLQTASAAVLDQLPAQFRLHAIIVWNADSSNTCTQGAAVCRSRQPNQ